MGKRSRLSENKRRSYQKQKKRQKMEAQLSKTSHSDPDSAGTGNDARTCLGPSTSATAYSTFESETTHYHVDLCSDHAIDEGSPFASHASVADPESPESPRSLRDLSWTTTDESGDDDPPNTVQDSFAQDSSPCATGSSSTIMGQSERDAMPVIVVDKKRKLEVHITDPEYQCLPGSEVLKLSTQEYLRRLYERETKSGVAMKCMRDRIETLEKKLLLKEKSSKIEKTKAVAEVTKFWRNCIVEGNTHGGKMVKKALKKK